MFVIKPIHQRANIWVVKGLMMRIWRRLFVVPMANNNHGKTTMIRALVSQGKGLAIKEYAKGHQELVTPSGRPVDSYIFGRSFQETEKSQYQTVENALDHNDSLWRERELIIMPSHVGKNDHRDIEEMIEVAHSAGFDAVAASVILTKANGDNRKDFPLIWKMNWDKRWTIPNPMSADPDGQLQALGRDLWFWISNALIE